MWSEKLAQGFNTAAQDSNPGSLSRESDALPLSHCAIQIRSYFMSDEIFPCILVAVLPLYLTCFVVSPQEYLRDRRDVEEVEEEVEEAPNGWGPWTAVGKCSRSCGGGIHFEERSCYQTR